MKKPVDEGQPFIGSHVAGNKQRHDSHRPNHSWSAVAPLETQFAASMCSNAVVYQEVGHRVPAIQEVFQFELATYSPRDASRQDHNHSHVWGITGSPPSKYRRPLVTCAS